MKRRFLAALMALLLLAGALPAGALAAKASIKLGGKLGLMRVGDETTLKPTLKNVKRKALSWTSSDAAVAVDGGKLTALAEGKAVITVSGGGARAKCGVVVLPTAVTLEAGEKRALPWGGLETYKLSDTAVATISKKGVITGKRAGEARLTVKYGKQKLTLPVRVVAQESPVSRLACAAETDQIVLVERTEGSKAVLTVHERRNGAWAQLLSADALVGKNGLGKAREGDQRTPSGTFNLTAPFGIKADPGANLPYTQVTKYHYWCGTSGSEYYNRLIDTRVIARKRTASDEYLLGIKPYYNYCLFIDYNASGEAGKGSCIFLHCTGSKKDTSGCVAVAESVMKKIIRWVKPGAKIVIREASDAA